MIKNSLVKYSIIVSSFILFLLLINCNYKNKLDIKAKNIDNYSNDSTEYYTNLLSKNPKDYNIYENFTNYYIRNQKYDNAMNIANNALKIDNTNIRAMMMKGNVYFASKLYDKAFIFYESVAQNDVKNIDSRLKLAFLYLALPNLDSAINNINNVLRIDNNNSEAYYLKGRYYELNGNYPLAKSSFHTAIEQNPNMYKSYIALGFLSQNTNDILAESYFESATNIEPKNTEGLRALAMCYSINNKYDKSIHILNRIIKLNPKSDMAYYDKATIILQQYGSTKDKQNLISSLKLYDSALIINPNYADAVYNKGVIYDELKNKDSAIYYYKKTLQVRENHELAIESLNRLDNLKK